MNTETKRHIDAARQVLVGVVPNPTSQIDQITNALIYKFMDDMDQSAIKQGGEPSFFVGDLKDYAWTRLMDTRIGNQERMNIYSEALVKFSESKQLPQLFREIFKSAFLPYRSPEVLGLFLKEISYFDYSHPEELGNAYEYLLSIMSSQGDAGQFRTPRHIIDFMVAVVNPTMEDKVLDPACGTGGFLVSAYNHIMEQHDGKNPDGIKNNEKPLTPDQRKNLMGNFEGYDVDPGMVRIAQVNMYLHQFKNPKIVQYDTLSMEERWGDKFSVILANPPFMSPKGGVSTHSKFSIQSTRSEVLFVDYIMNHLRPQGRAGIIVPEGIIFQSGKSHTQLRKNLVEDGLCAVVSLPSGVFQPYSGVKTSILLFDNEVAKKSKEILFVKIENDGFDLGATKRPSNKNDLPEALEILSKWKKGEKVESRLAIHVEKSKISENGDYNLSGDRYRVTTDYTNAKWPVVKLKELEESNDITLGRGKVISKIDLETKPGVYPVYSSSAQGIGEFGQYGDFMFDEELITWSVDGGGRFFYRPKHKFSVTNVSGWLRVNNPERINARFLYFVLDLAWQEKSFDYVSKAHPSVIREVYQIPLPPLEIQNQIVAELDGYQNIIAGARQITTNWKPSFVVDPEWEVKAVSEIAKLEYGIGEAAKNSGEYRYVRITDIGENGEIKNVDKKYINETAESKKYLLKKGDVLVARTGATFGKTMYFDENEKSAFAGFLIRFNFDEDRIFSKYFWCFAQSDNYWEQAKSLMTGGGQPQFNANAVGKIILPLPPLEIQKQIVERIESERTLVEGNKKLIEIYEQKTKDTLAKLWNE